MFCPKCKSEYVSGALLCADCDVLLVKEKPVELIEPEDRLVQLLKTTDIGLLAVVKSLLDSADIPYFVQGEEGLHVFPLATGGFFNPSAYGAVVLVRNEDYQDARELVQETVKEPDRED